MNAVKIGFGLGALALLAFVANKAISVSELAKKVTLKIVDFGLPSIGNSVVTVPLTARITNSSNETLTVDRVRVLASYLNASGNYVPAGAADVSGFTIVPGVVDKSFKAAIDLKSLTKNIADNLLAAFTTRAVQIRFDVFITINGLEVQANPIIRDVAL